MSYEVKGTKMADLEKAIEYIQHHGTLVEQAQLRYVLTGSPVSPEICSAFLEDQHPDGSWSPFWAPLECCVSESRPWAIPLLWRIELLMP